MSAFIEPTSKRVRLGEAFDVTVILDVAPLYEIYPLAASPPGVPTQLDLELPPEFQSIGNWSEPPTVRTQGPGAHRVHVGEVRFVRRVRTNRDARPGDYRVTCSIRYQACDERQCLAPASFALSATVSVHPGT